MWRHINTSARATCFDIVISFGPRAMSANAGSVIDWEKSTGTEMRSTGCHCNKSNRFSDLGIRPSVRSMYPSIYPSVPSHSSHPMVTSIPRTHSPFQLTTTHPCMPPRLPRVTHLASQSMSSTRPSVGTSNHREYHNPIFSALFSNCPLFSSIVAWIPVSDPTTGLNGRGCICPFWKISGERREISASIFELWSCTVTRQLSYTHRHALFAFKPRFTAAAFSICWDRSLLAFLHVLSTGNITFLPCLFPLYDGPFIFLDAGPFYFEMLTFISDLSPFVHFCSPPQSLHAPLAALLAALAFHCVSCPAAGHVSEVSYALGVVWPVLFA